MPIDAVYFIFLFLNILYLQSKYGEPHRILARVVDIIYLYSNNWERVSMGTGQIIRICYLNR